MNQGQIQEQRQEQRLTQTLSQQQLLVTQLLELPITQLQDRVNTEMNDNPALETSAEFPDDPDFPESAEYGDAPETTDDFDTLRDREDRQSALDEALQNIGRDDEELPVYQGGSNLAFITATQ